MHFNGIYAFLRFKKQKPYRKEVLTYSELAFTGGMMTQDEAIVLEEKLEEQLKQVVQPFEEKIETLIAENKKLVQQTKELEEQLLEESQKQEALENEKKHLLEEMNSLRKENAAPAQETGSASANESTNEQASPAPKEQENVYYKNCSQVRAAGKAPIYRGQSGYGIHLDRDGDGIACE